MAIDHLNFTVATRYTLPRLADAINAVCFRRALAVPLSARN